MKSPWFANSAPGFGGTNLKNSKEKSLVADRFDELARKSQTTGLSDKEVEELATLLNAPLLDRLENPPEGFVSKHQMVETDVVARIQAINWFANCGEPAEFDVTMKVERVKRWAQAMKACKTRSWQNTTLEARNQLTMALHNRDRQRYQKWNEITIKFKNEVTMPLTTKVWEPFQKSNGLEIELVHCVQWDILAALMENAYMSSNHGSFFFLELLSIYEAGHFPCGWRGIWPQGVLLVF
jgi:hypothetical protein